MVLLLNVEMDIKHGIRMVLDIVKANITKKLRGDRKMATITSPMLAATLKPEDINKLKFPVLATIKLDGIRCEIINGEAKSRTFKSIPNTYIRTELEKIFNFQDGQIFDGEILSGKSFQECSGNVMRHEGESDFKYYLFDYISDGLDEYYNKRMKKLEALVITDPRVIKLIPTMINNVEELEAFDGCRRLE